VVVAQQTCKCRKSIDCVTYTAPARFPLTIQPIHIRAIDDRAPPDDGHLLNVGPALP
jgi:hypothetical protein